MAKRYPCAILLGFVYLYCVVVRPLYAASPDTPSISIWINGKEQDCWEYVIDHETRDSQSSVPGTTGQESSDTISKDDSGADQPPRLPEEEDIPFPTYFTKLMDDGEGEGEDQGAEGEGEGELEGPPAPQVPTCPCPQDVLEQWVYALSDESAEPRPDAGEAEFLDAYKKIEPLLSAEFKVTVINEGLLSRRDVGEIVKRMEAEWPALIRDKNSKFYKEVFSKVTQLFDIKNADAVGFLDILKTINEQLERDRSELSKKIYQYVARGDTYSETSTKLWQEIETLKRQIAVKEFSVLRLLSGFLLAAVQAESGTCDPVKAVGGCGNCVACGILLRLLGEAAGLDIGFRTVIPAEGGAHVGNTFRLTGEKKRREIDLTYGLEPKYDKAYADNTWREGLSWLWYWKGIKLHGERRYKEALEAHKKAALLNPRDEFILYELAQTHYALGNYDEAIRGNLASLKINPRNSAALVSLGLAYEKMGKKQEAVEAFKRAVDSSPRHGDDWYNVGTAYVNLAVLTEDAQKKREYFTKARDSYLQATEIFEKEGKTDSMNDAYKKAQAASTFVK